MTNKQLHTELARLGACSDAVVWVGKRSPARAWRECERPDWLLWAAARMGAGKNDIVLAACDCAEWALRFVPEGEERPAKAIEAARLYIAGKLTLGELREAAEGAWAAAAAWAAAEGAARAAEGAAAEGAARAAARAAESEQQEARIILCGLIRSRLKMPRLPRQKVKKI